MTSHRNRSLQTIVGRTTYQVWIDMLHALVPDGRAHRLAPMIAGMLHYALNAAVEESGDQPDDRSVAQSLRLASEANAPDEVADLLLDVIEQLFEDAQVEYERVNHRGVAYSLVDRVIDEYVHWDNMPWES